VAITPFVNNVSAAVALAPIAVALAKTAGFDPEPFLIAVAVGVSLDFLTPFGHHNNALVMSIGNYRFGDFARLGLPLVVVSSAIAILAIRLAFQ
jgi:di/tricarboxylate transporter